MYFDKQTARAEGVSTKETTEVARTTKGYISDGCTHPVTISGGKYIILHQPKRQTHLFR
jgi:hypothetical protein